MNFARTTALASEPPFHYGAIFVMSTVLLPIARTTTTGPEIIEIDESHQIDMLDLSPVLKNELAIAKEMLSKC